MNDVSNEIGARRRGIFALAIAFVAAIGGFLFGFDLGLIGAANPFLRDQFHLSPSQLGFATGSAALGCVFGPFLGAWSCDAVGRKRTMIFASLLLAASAIVTAIARDITTFNIFRIVGGVGVGLCSVASPMYIAEVAPPRKRGSLGLMYQLAIVTGHITAPLVGFLLVSFLDDSISWRWMFASEMIFVVIFVVFVFYLPRSPRWLAEQGHFDEALGVLVKVDGADYGTKEMEEIKSSLEQESGGFSELFGPGFRYALLIGILLAFFNNWTGWSVMGGYIPILFEKSGLEDRAVAILRFAVTYGFMGLMTLVALWLVDRVGRRPLWIFASILMAIVTAITGAVFHYELSGGIVLLVIILCTVPHGLALGPLPWLMMSEIFPTRIRAKAVAITTTFLWITIYSGAQLFPLLTDYSEKICGSIGGAFWLFSVICLLSTAFGLTMMPETKGRTLEEIAEDWKRT
ncbi:MAG: sugar porter family MFS transporter [Candidatus Omnitrophica bacterium]|nr:sugar porter family MFS transporter [Candidatus Omnitrophota bacterium]